jgi:hypothetical protein
MKFPILRNGIPLLTEDGTSGPSGDGFPKLTEVSTDGEVSAECCCVTEFCEFCPCCIRCPDVSSTIDILVSGQSQDPDFAGVCDCDAFTSSPILGLAFDACTEISFFDIACDNSITFEIVDTGGSCTMRATLSGDSVHSGSPLGGPWTAIFEKALGAGPIECSAVHVLNFVSSTGGDDVPCLFAGSSVVVDILIPA